MILDLVEAFIEEKKLSANSRQSYYYDLQQFVKVVDGQIRESKLRLYEASLVDLKVSAKKRKISIVNQFLYYLYSKQAVEHYFRLENREKLDKEPIQDAVLDLEFYSVQTDYPKGKLIALLILECGLSPNELLQLKVEDIDLTFQVMAISRDGHHRIIKLSSNLAEYLEDYLSSQLYLFEHQGKVYSRQWIFNQLRFFLEEQGLSDLNAQRLREQYILCQKQKGLNSLEIAKTLGLKSQVTLEKYFK